MIEQSDNETWIGTFTPNFDNKTEDWNNALTLDNASYTDYDNNTGSGATSPNYMVDNIHPDENGSATITSVSYTHLTLPTILLV